MDGGAGATVTAVVTAVVTEVGDTEVVTGLAAGTVPEEASVVEVDTPRHELLLLLQLHQLPDAQLGMVVPSDDECGFDPPHSRTTQTPLSFTCKK